MYKQWVKAVESNLQRYRPGIKIDDISLTALSDAFQSGVTPYEFATQPTLPLRDVTARVSVGKPKRLVALRVSVAVLIALTLSLGNVHIIQSSSGTSVLRKVHFTFRETFVSLDAITSQPLLSAKAQNPLGVKALQEVGMLETDEQMQERTILEAQKEFNDRAEREADKIARDLVVSRERRVYDGSDTWIEGVLTNSGSKSYTYVGVVFNLFDGKGNILDTTAAHKGGSLNPGETWKFKALILDVRGVQGFNVERVDGLLVP